MVDRGDEMRLQKVRVVGITEVGVVDVFVFEPVCIIIIIIIIAFICCRLAFAVFCPLSFR